MPRSQRVSTSTRRYRQRPAGLHPSRPSMGSKPLNGSAKVISSAPVGSQFPGGLSNQTSGHPAWVSVSARGPSVPGPGCARAAPPRRETQGPRRMGGLGMLRARCRWRWRRRAPGLPRRACGCRAMSPPTTHTHSRSRARMPAAACTSPHRHRAGSGSPPRAGPIALFPPLPSATKKPQRSVR